MAGTKKKNRTGELQTFLSRTPMRSALFELGSGGGLLGTRFHFWSGPRPISPYQKRQITTATQIPGEKLKSA